MSDSRTTASVRPRGARDEGYVLVSVLWVLGVLAAAVAGMSFFSARSLTFVATSSDWLKTEALARAGLEVAVFKMQGADLNQAMCGRTTWQADEGAARLSWVGETSRVDLNLAPPPLLKSVLAQVAPDETTASEAAAAILQRRPAENPGQPSGPKIVYQSVAELDQTGLSPDLLSRLEPYVTVFNGRPQIDPRLAPEQLLSSLPEISEARLRRLLDLKGEEKADIAAWRREAGPAGAFLTLDASNAVRIRIIASLASGFSRAYDVVVARLEEDSEPYRILSWRDASLAEPPDSCTGDLR
jgi:general secretion pathway protein K